MPQIVRCPDCGGIVGTTETTDEGPPCSCFETPPPSQGENDSSGTQVMPSPAVIAKVCCVCGKDLAGKKRIKDSRGYWCPDCIREDEKKNEAKGVKCEKCSRVVPAQSLTSADGKMICSRCLREARQLREPGNKKFRAISDRTYKEAEKKKIVIMVVVLIVLAILMFISWQRFPGLSPKTDGRTPGVEPYAFVAPGDSFASRSFVAPRAFAPHAFVEMHTVAALL